MQVFCSWGLRLYIYLFSIMYYPSKSHMYFFGSSLLLPEKAGSVLPDIPALGWIPSAKLSSEMLLYPFSCVLIMPLT